MLPIARRRCRVPFPCPAALDLSRRPARHLGVLPLAVAAAPSPVPCCCDQVTVPFWALISLRCTSLPSRRGKFRSKPWQAVLDEARHLVDSGVVELNLIAEVCASLSSCLWLV